MKLKTLIAIVVLGATLPAFAQTTDSEPQSLGDAARMVKDGGKPKAVAQFTNDTEALRKPPIADVAVIGSNNIDEILQGIEDFRSNHNLRETEAAVHDWYNQQAALFRNAIAEKKHIQQRQQLRSSSPDNYDVRPNNHDQYVNLKRTEKRSVEDEERQIKQNQRLMDRIQQDFYIIRPELEKRYKMNVDWFTICDGVVCSY
jgi:CHAT domain-containing protein